MSAEKPAHHGADHRQPGTYGDDDPGGEDPTPVKTGSVDAWQLYRFAVDDTNLGDLSVDGVGALGNSNFANELGRALIVLGLPGGAENPDNLTHETVMGRLSAIVVDATAFAGGGDWRIVPTWNNDYAGAGPYFVGPSKVGSGVVIQASTGGDPSTWARYEFDCLFELSGSNSYIVPRMSDGTRVDATHPITLANDDQIVAHWEDQTQGWD